MAARGQLALGVVLVLDDAREDVAAVGLARRGVDRVARLKVGPVRVFDANLLREKYCTFSIGKC